MAKCHLPSFGHVLAKPCAMNDRKPMPVAIDYASLVAGAWNSELSFTDLLNQASALEAQGQLALSAVLYQTWLSRNASPLAHAGYFNWGTVLFNLNDVAAAEQAYRKAIELAPGFVHPHSNLGSVLERLGKADEALQQWQWVADHCPRDDASRPMVVMALNNIGRVCESQKKFDQALEALTNSLALEPQQPDVLHHWVFLRQKQCAWPVYATVSGVTEQAMRDATSALAMLSVSDDPGAQLAAAQRYVDKKLLKGLPVLAPAGAYGHQRLRIGYCSSDFCLHPVSMLTVQLLELHDRGRFEVYGYCWSPEDGSDMRRRMIAAMDHHIPIHHLSDEAAAQLIRSHEIDVLIDLQGQTSGARANVLGYRPATIQITYLGLPATTGLPSIDYVIADTFLIPPAMAEFYSEKPLYMPHVYQVSDRLRPSSAAPTRASCGLPEEGFVFCSFNNSFKYTPEVFDVWLRLLEQVPGSVLWLLADNPWAEANLRARASQAGIEAGRLVFAGRVSPENYLARYLIADLFLDTFPFNAGTTANDCLWMGCPLLTLTGRSFASRMAGALLTAAGLPELVTYDLAEYEAKATQLAQTPDQPRHLRAKLQQVRESGTLFDTPRFVRDLESRLIELVDALPVPGQPVVQP